MKKGIAILLLICIACAMLFGCGGKQEETELTTGAATESSGKPATEPTTAPTESAPTQPEPTEPAPTQPEPTEPAPTQPSEPDLDEDELPLVPV